FFNDTATTEIYTLSLHDALPISAAAAEAAPHGNAAKKFTMTSQPTAARALGANGRAVADTSIPRPPMIPARSGPSTRPRRTNQSAAQPPASAPTTPTVAVSRPITRAARPTSQP